MGMLTCRQLKLNENIVIKIKVYISSDALTKCLIDYDFVHTFADTRNFTTLRYMYLQRLNWVSSVLDHPSVQVSVIPPANKVWGY